MKDDVKEKVEQEIDGWKYMEELPGEWHGFVLSCEKQVVEDRYELYRYANENRHRSISVYYHEETHEYKVRTAIGLIEFCRIEFITGKFSVFEELLRLHFEPLLRDMAAFNPKTVTSLLLDKGIMEWQYGRDLPQELEGFQLFSRPCEPIRIANGSYIIFDYVDFAMESNFNIYYNIFRDEFFGESRVRNIPEVTYAFDSTELVELEEKLKNHMVAYLKEIRKKAEGGALK